MDNHQDTKAPRREPISEAIDRIARQIVDSAFRVHSTLGPGLLESVYETCLFHEMRTRGLFVERQKSLPIIYGDVRLEDGLRLDFLVENCVVVEVKAADQWHKVFEAQLLTYLKLSGLRLGLLINFNMPTIKQGIRRMVL